MKLHQHRQTFYPGTSNQTEELSGIFSQYQPGKFYNFNIALRDFDGNMFSAKVHYRLAFFNHVTVCRVTTAGNDITLSEAVQQQMGYLTARAELDAQGRNMGDGAIKEIDFAIHKTNAL